MKSVIVYDNIIFSLQKAGGISAFWAELLKRIIGSKRFDCYFIEYEGSCDNIFRKSLDIPPHKIIVGKKLPFNFHRILEPYIPPVITRKPFIFHSSYYRTFTHPRALNVSTFHDFIHEHGGDGNLITRNLMKSLHLGAIKKSRHCVCVSQHTKEDLLSLFRDKLSVQISVAYNAPVNQFEEKNKAGKEHLLFVGARDQYKNFRFAVQLSEACGVPLKVVGSPFTREENRFIRNKKVELDIFPDSKRLMEHFQKAIALVYMSEYEGFGIPVVEAQAATCPVLTIKRGALPEIAGEGAVILDNIDLTQAKEKVIRLRDDISFRNDIVRKGEINVGRFSWDRTADQYIKIYSDLLRKNL